MYIDDDEYLDEQEEIEEEKDKLLSLPVQQAIEEPYYWSINYYSYLYCLLSVKHHPS